MNPLQFPTSPFPTLPMLDNSPGARLGLPVIRADEAPPSFGIPLSGPPNFISPTSFTGPPTQLFGGMVAPNGTNGPIALNNPPPPPQPFVNGTDGVLPPQLLSPPPGYGPSPLVPPPLTPPPAALGEGFPAPAPQEALSAPTDRPGWIDLNQVGDNNTVAIRQQQEYQAFMQGNYSNRLDTFATRGGSVTQQQAFYQMANNWEPNAYFNVTQTDSPGYNYAMTVGGEFNIQQRNSNWNTSVIDGGRGTVMQEGNPYNLLYFTNTAGATGTQRGGYYGSVFNNNSNTTVRQLELEHAYYMNNAQGSLEQHATTAGYLYNLSGGQLTASQAGPYTSASNWGSINLTQSGQYNNAYNFGQGQFTQQNGYLGSAVDAGNGHWTLHNEYNNYWNPRGSDTINANGYYNLVNANANTSTQGVLKGVWNRANIGANANVQLQMRGQFNNFNG